MGSWHILKYPIPNVWQLVLAKVPVEGVVDSDEQHGLVYGPGDAWASLSTLEKLSNLME